MKLIQITDFHLQETPDTLHNGVDPEVRFDAVLAAIREEHADCDLLLMTGDLAHHGYESAYQRIEMATRHLAKQRCWLPGNHDDASKMQRFTELAQQRLIMAPWDILLLDSTSQPDGVGSGSLADAELERLANFLQAPKAPFQMVALHHPPLPVGSRWQDEIRLGNSAEFLSIVERYASNALKLVVCGHLHQAHELALAEAQLISTPATAAQFVSFQATPQIELRGDASLPAYRWFELDSNGCFKSAVQRVPLA
ncbi:metallophosphoesterase [Neptunomonas sp. XY-337]|uniref:metallophosphoesterase n=1 Tax=Neptunomonas sp. XY-337 TaxID=2561897 RepID=UPI0010AB4BC0|nr:metallophosphoesterase [Neptunomonas sp. XY-337]